MLINILVAVLHQISQALLLIRSLKRS